MSTSETVETVKDPHAFGEERLRRIFYNALKKNWTKPPQSLDNMSLVDIIEQKNGR